MTIALAPNSPSSRVQHHYGQDNDHQCSTENVKHPPGA